MDEMAEAISGRDAVAVRGMGFGVWGLAEPLGRGGAEEDEGVKGEKGKRGIAGAAGVVAGGWWLVVGESQGGETSGVHAVLLSDM